MCNNLNSESSLTPFFGERLEGEALVLYVDVELAAVAFCGFIHRVAAGSSESLRTFSICG